MSVNRFPRDLAEAICAALVAEGDICPEFGILVNLLETMYFASFETEEARSVTFDVVYLNPQLPGEDDEEESYRRRVRYHARAVPFSSPKLATVETLVKLASASDPRTSTLAVHADENGAIVIWGLIDQDNSSYSWLNYDFDGPLSSLGRFRIRVLGVGHIAVFLGHERVAELRGRLLVPPPIDVFKAGPVHDRLRKGIAPLVSAVLHATPELREIEDEKERAERLRTLMHQVRFHWFASLRRMLLRMRRFRHGGALLFNPSATNDGLDIKYAIEYSRLPAALEAEAVSRFKHDRLVYRIEEDFLDATPAVAVPPDLAEKRVELESEVRQSGTEVDGAVWFISALTRVDGLVLLAPDLTARGFGVEITELAVPEHVYRAGDAQGREEHFTEAEYAHFGTRHRSMMRYCNKVPGSIGFVVSQDGDVRCMMRVGTRLVLWDNLRLEFYFPYQSSEQPAGHSSSPGACV